MEPVKEFPKFVHNMPELDLPIPGARGWCLQGENHQMVFVEFTETVDVPEHSHAEQWEFALAGKVVVHRHGSSTAYGPGERFYLLDGEPHGATVYEGYKAMILFNDPDRYKVKE